MQHRCCSGERLVLAVVAIVVCPVPFLGVAAALRRRSRVERHPRGCSGRRHRRGRHRDRCRQPPGRGLALLAVPPACSRFKLADVPRGKGFYGIEVGHRGIVRYSEQDIVSGYAALELGRSS